MNPRRGSALFLAATACVLALSSQAATLRPQAAAGYSARHDERALIIMQDGRILLERGDALPVFINSITKSLTALSTLAFCEARGLPLDAPAHRGITWRQLLAQTSGLPPDYPRLYSGSLTSKSARVLALKPLSPPGTRFAYGPSHYELVAALIGQRVSPDGARRVAEKYALHALGIDTSRWRRDRQGEVFYSAGLLASPRQLLRAGRMVERGGWSGWWPVISHRSLEEALRGSPANPAYGLGFWLNRAATRPRTREADIEALLSENPTSWQNICFSRSAPPDLVIMAGSGGHRVYVSKSARLVVVRLGQGRRKGFRDPGFLAALFGGR